MISVIMATTPGREAFLEIARRCFERQSYTDRELIVVGGHEPLGVKLNRAAEEAQGEVLCKWDDDDWYSPVFLERAVDRLGGADAIAAWERFHIFVTGETKTRFSEMGWPAGGTICFPRQVWEQTRFRPAARNVDQDFRLDTKRRVLGIQSPDYVLVRHDSNLWAGSSWDLRMRSRPVAGPLFGFAADCALEVMA